MVYYGGWNVFIFGENQPVSGQNLKFHTTKGFAPIIAAPCPLPPVSTPEPPVMCRIYCLLFFIVAYYLFNSDYRLGNVDKLLFLR